MAIQNEPGARIFHGFEQPLREVENHFDIPGITRHLLLDNRMLQEKSFHIAVHHITGSYVPTNTHCSAHTHDFDEINLLISETETLVYEYKLNGVVEAVKSPACIYIPAGVEHYSKAILGTGMLVCIRLDHQPKKTAES